MNPHDLLAVAMYEWATLSVVTWVVSTTVSRARVLQPVREAIQRRSEYLGEGISCQYCISHWVGFGVVVVAQPHFLPFGATGGFYAYCLGLFLHTFAVVGASALIARTIGKTPEVRTEPVTAVEEETEVMYR